MIDVEGYRANVGIILRNAEGKLLWARRIGQDAWQFPQGGIREDESPEEAMYRELFEEIGLDSDDVALVGRTRDWLRYRLPRRHLRHYSKPLCIGQKQVWFLLNLIAADSKVRFDRTEEPEFDHWRWVDYWRPLDEVVAFKRKVYELALSEFAPLVVSGEAAIPRRRRRRK